MKSYSEFKHAIRLRESSGNYQCVNKFGFLGAYQFGRARLCDLGLTQRIDPHSKGFANSDFQFIPPMSQSKFLASERIQDFCFDRHVYYLKKEVQKICGPEISLSGAIAACHLLGVGGLSDFIFRGINSCDALGTKLSDYLNEFSGYEIPDLTQAVKPVR